MPALLTVTKNGITMTVSPARAQTDDGALAAGVVKLLVFPRVVKADSEGGVISDEFLASDKSGIGPFTVTLSDDVMAAVNAQVKAAFDADQAARAAAQTP